MIVRDPYIAIADPIRREILDLLRFKPLVPAGEIAAHFGEVSRPAISRHLRILKECGVVCALRQGKSQHYSLLPDPLNKIRQGWLAGFGDVQSRSLTKLRDMVENR